MSLVEINTVKPGINIRPKPIFVLLVTPVYDLIKVVMGYLGSLCTMFDFILTKCDKCLFFT